MTAMVPARLWGSFLGLFLCFGVAVAQGGDDLPDLIKKVVDASGRLRYSGTRVVLLKFGPDQQRHVEIVKKAGPKTRIEFPEEGSFRGQIIVETENERRHYFPEKNQIEVLPPRRDELNGRWLKMGRRGGPKPTFKIANGSVILGVPTKQVEVGAENGFVFQRMWVDPRTGLVLKREMYGRDGTIQASSEFTKLDYSPDFSRSDFVLNVSGAKIVTPRDRLGELLQKEGYLNVSLSPKDPFKLESCRIQRIGNVPALVQDYVNKDGRVTLFQFRADVDQNRLRKFGRGEVRTISWQRNGSTFVLLGTPNESKLQEIAQRLGG
jgi:outer membrane lipoprotein-sorting protein